MMSHPPNQKRAGARSEHFTLIARARANQSGGDDIGHANMLLRLDQLVEAGSAFRRCIEDFDDGTESLNGLIAAASRMTDRHMAQEAEELLLWLLNGPGVLPGVDPAALSLGDLANSFLALGMPAEAVRACDILRPIEDPQAIEIKAHASVMQGNDALGRQGFREALGKFETLIAGAGNGEVAPLVGAARCRMGLDNLTRHFPEKREENLQAALHHLQAALGLRPDDVSVKLLAADVQLRRGKPGAALEGFKQVLAVKPQNVEALRGKALAEGGLGMPVDALMTARELPAGDPVFSQSVVNAVKWRSPPAEGVAPPEPKKRRLT